MLRDPKSTPADLNQFLIQDREVVEESRRSRMVNFFMALAVTEPQKKKKKRKQANATP